MGLWTCEQNTILLGKARTGSHGSSKPKNLLTTVDWRLCRPYRYLVELTGFQVAAQMESYIVRIAVREAVTATNNMRTHSAAGGSTHYDSRVLDSVGSLVAVP